MEDQLLDEAAAGAGAEKLATSGAAGVEVGPLAGFLPHTLATFLTFN